MVLMTNIGGHKANDGLMVLASKLYATFAALETGGRVKR